MHFLGHKCFSFIILVPDAAVSGIFLQIDLIEVAIAVPLWTFLKCDTDNM